MDMETKRALLAVLAHPDDETFGMGGTLALYARQGVDVYLICATRGEAGEVEKEHLQGFSTVAERRESELRCAANILGLKGVFFLGYRDSGMPGSVDNFHPQALCVQPVEEVAERIASLILEIKPQVVITFDPIGGYRHPDHVAIHQATVRAFEQLAMLQQEGKAVNPVKKLYFHTIPRTLLRLIVLAMKLRGKDPRRFGKNGDIDLASIAAEQFPIHAVVDYRQVARVRERAVACHVSQGGASLTGVGIFAQIRRWFFSRDVFMRAYPPAGKGSPKENDLFEGIYE